MHGRRPHLLRRSVSRGNARGGHRSTATRGKRTISDGRCRTNESRSRHIRSTMPDASKSPRRLLPKHVRTTLDKRSQQPTHRSKTRFRIKPTTCNSAHGKKLSPDEAHSRTRKSSIYTRHRQSIRRQSRRRLTHTKHDCKITEALYVTWMECGTGIIVWDIGAGRLQRVAGQAYSIVPLTTPRQHPLPEILPMIDGSVNIARLPGLNWNQTSSINAYKRGILTLEALPASERNRMLSRYARKKVMTHESIARTKEKARIEIIQENGKSRGLNKSERITMIKTTRQYRVNRSTRTHLLSRPRMVPRRRRPSQEVDE